MNFNEIVTAARESTQLSDPELNTWQEGLHILLRDHAKSDLLTERGNAILKNRYVKALSARMQVDDFIRHHPEVLDKPIERPVFILGLVRTGTTMTSYLMDADPAVRSLLRWESYEVAPPAAPGMRCSDKRCIAEKATDEAMIRNNPKGVATHFEAADGPTECVHLLAQDFRSMMFTVLSTTPVYSDWILDCDMSSAFEHRKRVFHVLQSTNPGRWVLKMPSDSVFIPWIFKTFPDAKVIWMHRDPYVAFASSFSMRGRSRLIFNKHMDMDYMRCKWPLQLSLHLRRPLEWAKERPNDLYNLYYHDMMKDPISEMKKVYAWLGDPWTEEAEIGMYRWLDENPQGRFGKHTYDLNEWGFTKKELEPYFADYLKVHPVATS